MRREHDSANVSEGMNEVTDGMVRPLNATTEGGRWSILGIPTKGSLPSAGSRAANDEEMRCNGSCDRCQKRELVVRHRAWVPGRKTHQRKQGSGRPRGRQKLFRVGRRLRQPPGGSAA